MNLGIVGTGAMGSVLFDYAVSEGTFQNIFFIEPLEKDSWPEERMDLLIDFSHPSVISQIYDYCRKQGGNIAVVLATTGYGPEEEKLIELLEKICPVSRSANYSKGIAAMMKLCGLGWQLLGDKSDIRILETHHTKKQDAPSGTAVSLCRAVHLDPRDEDKVLSLRMGTICGEHSVFFALEDEVVEIRHTALSKKIFAIGALEAGKRMLERKG